jgi:hypothetical protein
MSAVIQLYNPDVEVLARCPHLCESQKLSVSIILFKCFQLLLGIYLLHAGRIHK